MNGFLTYRMSPFLNIQEVENGGEKLKVFNYISGRTFELGTKAVEILRYFRKPHTIPEMSDHFELEKSTAQNVVENLLQVKLLLEQGKEDEFAKEITLPAQTLFGVPEKVSPLNRDGEKRIRFTGIPFGRGNDIGYGTEDFPDHLRSKTHYLHFTPTNVEHINFDFLDGTGSGGNLSALFKKERVTDAGNIFIDFSESTDFIYEKIADISADLFRSGDIPFFIGGDHSITYPIVKGAAETHERFSILHFDAHSDTSFSKYDKIKHGRKTSHTHANVISRCMELEAVEAVYHFGLRGITNRFVTEDPREKVCWAADTDAVISGRQAIELDRSQRYYITIDIDVIDPSYAPGTGSPAINGISPRQLFDLMKKLLPGLDIIGADIVEVNPSKDPSGITTQTATEVILHLMNYMYK